MSAPTLPPWKSIMHLVRTQKTDSPVWNPLFFEKTPKSGTKGHNVLSTGQQENDFSLSCFPAAQRIDLILTVI